MCEYRCPKCGSTNLYLEWDPEVEVIACRVCGKRIYGQSRVPSDDENAEARWQEYKFTHKRRRRSTKRTRELRARLKRAISQPGTPSAPVRVERGLRRLKKFQEGRMRDLERKFDEFRKSRWNTAYQRIRMADGVELQGKYPVSDEAAAWLPSDLRGKSVIDLRCDMGGYCLEAARRGAVKVVGVDRNNAAVAGARGLLSFAREFDKYADYSVISYQHVEPALVAVDAEYDLVLCLSMMQHTPRPRLILEKALQLLKQGGLLVLEILNGHHPDLPEHINSWQPADSTVLRTLQELGLELTMSGPGRAHGRSIYVASRGEKTMEVSLKMPEPSEPLDEVTTEPSQEPQEPAEDDGTDPLDDDVLEGEDEEEPPVGTERLYWSEALGREATHTFTEEGWVCAEETETTEEVESEAEPSPRAMLEKHPDSEDAEPDEAEEAEPAEAVNGGEAPKKKRKKIKFKLKKK